MESQPTTLELDDGFFTSPTNRDYQAFWTTSAAQGWLDQVLAEVATWVDKRLGLNVDLSTDGEAANADRSRRVQVLHRSASKETGVRIRVWNVNRSTTFVVTILAIDGPGGGWLLVQASSSDQSRRTAKPAIADAVLSVVDFDDAGPLRATAQHIPYSALDDFEALLNDPARRLPVLVAAPVEGVEFARWMQAVNAWTRHCAGIAHVASLDPHSAREFRTRHGRRGVQSGTLRTYPPGTDLADPAIESTARWITTQTLTGADASVARVIENFVRQYQVTHPVPLPPAVREWSRAFERFSAQRLRSALTPDSPTLLARVAARQASRSQDALRRSIPQTGPTSKDDGLSRTVSADPVSIAEGLVAALQAQLLVSEQSRADAVAELHHVQEFLALPDLEDAALLELLDAATRVQPEPEAIKQLLGDNDELRTKLEGVEDALFAEQINSSDLARERDRLDVLFAAKTREAAFLRGKVAESDPSLAYAWSDDQSPTNPLGECPAEWDVLMSDPRLPQSGLIFTGNVRSLKEVRALDLDKAGLRAAWDALGTMASYRAARVNGSWEKGVHAFCESGPSDAFHVPPNKHAPDETSGTRKDGRLADYRLLPVPRKIEKVGHVHMWAHFKPYSWSAHQKLRIHYYDQVSIDGKIYIGYAGPHLPSGSTDKVHR